MGQGSCRTYPQRRRVPGAVSAGKPERSRRIRSGLDVAAPCRGTHSLSIPALPLAARPAEPGRTPSGGRPASRTRSSPRRGPATGRTLDEYELTEHYRRWREDLGLMAELGSGGALRRSLASDSAGARPMGLAATPTAARAAARARHRPQVDLVHYGLPGWIEGAFLNPDYPRWWPITRGGGRRFKGRSIGTRR